MPTPAARSPPLHLLEHTEFPPASITRHIRSVGIGTVELNRFAVGVASAVSNLEALPKHNPHVMSGL